jgi:hypothetical protein
VQRLAGWALVITTIQGLRGLGRDGNARARREWADAQALAGLL